MLQRDEQQELIRSVYPELREMAARLLSRERQGHTLQRTALVHETFLRLFGKNVICNLSPEQFLGLAAHQMRRILIDYGRKHHAKKRGGDVVRVPLMDCDHSIIRDEDTLLSLNEALDRLANFDSRASAVVELKYFGGFTNAEAGRILGLSEGTIDATWQHARLWLFRELSKESRNANDGRRSGFTESFQQA